MSFQTFEVNFLLVIRISVEETISRVRSGPSYYYGIVRLSSSIIDYQACLGRINDTYI